MPTDQPDRNDFAQEVDPGIPEPAPVNNDIKVLNEEVMNDAAAPTENEQTVPFLPPITQLPSTATPSTYHCKCLKSKCLKLYCDCFRHNSLCSSACNCHTCSNLAQHNGPGGARTLAMLATLRSRPNAFDGGLPLAVGNNEESVVLAYEEAKRMEESKEEMVKPPSKVKRQEVEHVKEKKMKRSKWTLPPLEPIPIPNYSLEEVLADYSGHLYSPPPVSLEEFPTLAIDSSKDYSSLVYAFKEPLFKDPSPPLSIAYNQREAASAERNLLHSKKAEIISRLDEIRRQFAETKAELLNLNLHLKTNSQKLGSWTHKVFELELAERPCGFNEKMERLGQFVERYGVLPTHAGMKKMNLEELETSEMAEEDVGKEGDDEVGEQQENIADAAAKAQEEGAETAKVVADESATEPVETIEPSKEEGVPTQDEASPLEESKQSEVELPPTDDTKQDLPNSDTEHLTESNEQPMEDIEQCNKENEPSAEQPTQKQPPFTEEETKSLAAFISSMKLKVKKDKSLVKTQPHRIRALEEYGVRLFENESAARFDVMFEKLLAYKKEMGTFRMPSADLCKDSGDEELIALHNWVFSQVGSFRYQLKSKKVSDVKKFLDVGFSFEKWYGSNGHVFERDIPPFDTFARQYVENNGIAPQDYEEMLRGHGKFGGKKRKSLHGPKVKRYPGEPDRRLKKNRIALKEAAEKEAAANAANVDAPVVNDEDLDGSVEQSAVDAAEV
ncbi:hypothetical protein ACHAXN_009319 [Cyclotella atomus]